MKNKIKSAFWRWYCDRRPMGHKDAMLYLLNLEFSAMLWAGFVTGVIVRDPLFLICFLLNFYGFVIGIRRKGLWNF